MFKNTIFLALIAILLSACASSMQPKDYSLFREANPRSVVIVPVINHSQEAEAADLFLTTLAIPLAERGYYVFPTNMVRSMMEEDGLADAHLVHSTETPILGSLFGADAILYVEILDWKSQYALLSSSIVVEFLYTLKDARTGALLWQDQQQFIQQKGGSSGNIFADMIAAAITAGVDNAKSDYTPAAHMANAMAMVPPGQGLPFGPYSPNYGTDQELYAATGSGHFSDATEMAVSYPVSPQPADDQINE
ncbi:lipoprotein [Iodidimonas gelatinilytica]|uniref:Lipoprotein n=1 Tax=Iodidimonas gelatinilytica TaxID=1236966 RepID=A0A5A7MT20_9PROT|nr:GNA1162 family protein [Iodidimonas gelatinilytica]GEQ99040.1 lipoprotein [Iodidimonas gelatinilytica]